MKKLIEENFHSAFLDLPVCRFSEIEYFHGNKVLISRKVEFL